MTRVRVLATAATCLWVAQGATAESNNYWQVEAVNGKLAFYAEVLKGIGASVAPAAERDADDRLNVEFQATGRLELYAPGAIFNDVGDGALRLSSKGVLRGRRGRVRLGGLELRRGPDERTFVLVGADGYAWFEADHMHFSSDREAGSFRMYNLDVRLTADGARRMGEPRYAGLPVAVLEMEASIPALVGAVEAPLGQCTGPDWGQPHNDVALINISAVSQMARDAGPPVRVAIAPSSVLKNVGQTDVPWYVKFSAPNPPYNNDQHPFLVWNLFRISGGRIEQIGVSPLKHAFTTVNTNCPCPGGSILWVGCEDTYGTGTNDSSNSLGPRSELLPHVGYWQRCGSIFDTNCDGISNSAPRSETMDRRMAVLETDLQTAGAQYFLDSWYIVRDDVDIFNTMGWRRITPNAPTPPATQWTFTLATTLAAGPTINHWVDPNAPGPNAQSALIDTPVGDLRLAVRATDLGGGQWRYEYALMNFDFDSSVKSFSLPVPSGAVVTAAGFRDVDQDAGTDWAFTTGANTITWTAPSAAAAQRWSTLYNFGFTVNAAPTATSGSVATMGVQASRGWQLQPAILGPGVLTVADKDARE